MMVILPIDGKIFYTPVSLILMVCSNWYYSGLFRGLSSFMVVAVCMTGPGLRHGKAPVHCLAC